MSVTGALYRKYRPQTFAEVRDQDHIVTVLEGAIRKGEIPHALLFSGTRGTGKTTLARIFAKAIGTSDLDLYEIDAASNRGIDDVRELKEAVHTMPYESPQKVYIIDEVHMLTKEAFNALLKTLEEPPSHVVFHSRDDRGREITRHYSLTLPGLPHAFTIAGRTRRNCDRHVPSKKASLSIPTQQT
jgi:DNA polymerase III gamma/tau subunit